MPCNDPRDDYDKAHNNEAAELLCGLLKQLPDVAVPWTDELRRWWIDHQFRDAYHDRMSRRKN